MPQLRVEIDVNELVYHELERNAKAVMTEQINTERKKLAEQSSAIEQQTQQLEATLNERLAAALSNEKAALETKLIQQLEEQQGGLIQGLQAPLQEQANKLTHFNQAQLEIERLKHEKTILRSEIELDLQRKMSKLMQAQKETFRTKTQEEMSTSACL